MPNKTIAPWKVAVVLVGFPLTHLIYSQALLHREFFTFGEIDFFLTFWIGSTIIYLAKILIVVRLLKRSGWTPSDIGYTLSRRGTTILVSTYFAAALLLVGLVELALTHVELDPERLATMRGLFADTTPKRLVFILMGFAAGLSEEIVYRGFAIRSLENFRVNRWLAVLLAAIPFVFQHGIKSLDQFWWFLLTGIAFGFLFVATKRLLPGIIIHWIVILMALLGIFSAVVR